jgi:hypothetical protein
VACGPARWRLAHYHCISAAQSRIMLPAMDDAITGARRPNLPSRNLRDASARDPFRRHSARIHLCRADMRAPGMRGGKAGGREKISRPEKSNGPIAAGADSPASARILVVAGARRRRSPNPSRTAFKPSQAQSSMASQCARASDRRRYARRGGRDIALLIRTFEGRSSR